MTRRQLREHCFKVLFCTDFYPASEVDEQIMAYFEQEEVKLNEEEAAELKDRADAMLARIPEIDEILASVTEGWSLKRVGRVELSLLRVACYEIKFDQAVPDKVAINEAVELARKYSGDEAPGFVNGVLAKLV